MDKQSKDKQSKDKSKKKFHKFKSKGFRRKERFPDIHPNLPNAPRVLFIVGAIKSSKSNLIINCLCNKDFI